MKTSLTFSETVYHRCSRFAWVGGGTYNGDSNTLLIHDRIFANSPNGDVGQGGGVHNESGELTMDRLTRMLTGFKHAWDDGGDIHGNIPLLS